MGIVIRQFKDPCDGHRGTIVRMASTWRLPAAKEIQRRIFWWTSTRTNLDESKHLEFRLLHWIDEFQHGPFGVFFLRGEKHVLKIDFSLSERKPSCGLYPGSNSRESRHQATQQQYRCSELLLSPMQIQDDSKPWLKCGETMVKLVILLIPKHNSLHALAETNHHFRFSNLRNGPFGGGV